MRKFIESLPGYNGEITEELISITFDHFMDGTKMYFDGGYEITTQAGFENAVVENYKWKRHKIRKMIRKYNQEYITPDAYRELNYKHKYYSK